VFTFPGKNAEGRDIMTDMYDVVVPENGAIGNVTLKTLEGAAKMVIYGLDKAFNSSTVLEGEARQAASNELWTFGANLHPSTYGGAVLLNVNGYPIISHGTSDATAIMNSARVAAEMAGSTLVEDLRAAFKAFPTL
jgi:glycerol-3-phosphate acyltransferase PlsX